MNVIKHKFFKLALGIEYNGSRYYGWQYQQKLCSIQENLEKAISKVANHQVDVFCAGRTDAGVHSIGQVIHFKTYAQRSQNSWTLGINSNLAHDIAVQWVKIVPQEFHARFSAISRRYCYVIYNQRFRSAVLGKNLAHFYYPLDTEKMHIAGQFLLGEKDFTSFRAAGCQSNTPWRNIIYIKVIRRGSYVIIDIKANSFLRHMVRNIVGSLIEIGRGKKPKDWILMILAAKDRTMAAFTAKPEGLYLVEINYPSYFEIPKPTLEPFFL